MARCEHGDGRPAGLRIWHARVRASACDGLLGLLSPEERRRHAALPAPVRDPYVTAHALVRLAVAEFLADRAPREVRLGRNRAGRPEVLGAPWLSVSLSHTGGAVLAACSVAGPVGVDIERVRPLRRPADLAARILDPADLARWRTRPRAERETALLRRWTCKEAVLKAAGCGLAGGVSHVVRGREGRWTLPSGRGGTGRVWWTAQPEVGAEHVAAVAVGAWGDSDEPLLQRESHGERAVGRVELGEEVGDVPFGAVFRDADASGDLLVAAALGQQGEHLLFAGGE